MPRWKDRLPRRSRQEWAAQFALVLGMLVLGYFATTHSLAQALRTNSPEQAYALAPYDGRVTAHLSAELSGPQATSAQRNASDRLARKALRQDPTSVAAVATLGLNYQIRGDTDNARRHFAYSNKLSRRDLRTRLWMIEDAVAREDIPGALYNYDIALRTSRRAPPLLYPVLTAAISDASIRSELVRRLAAKPMWGGGFVMYIAAHGEDPLATAHLFDALRGVNVKVPDEAKAGVIDKLISNKNYSAAWAFYAGSRSDADRKLSRDATFEASLTKPSSFDWIPLGGKAGISTVIHSANKNGLFDFSAPPSVGGPLLRQMQLLPAGSYILEGHSIGIEQAERALPYWVLTCVDGRELGRVVVSNSSRANGRFRGQLTVPSGCPAQYLQLVARPSSAIGGLSGQIDEVQLRPAN